MSEILVTTDEQKLHITNGPTVSAQGVNENYLVFTFDSYWEDLTKVAIFYRKEDENTVYESVIDGDNRAVIPHEVTDQDGRVCFGIYGVNSNDQIYTSDILTYKVVNGLYNGAEEPDPSSSVYEQILALLSAAPTSINSLAQMVNTNKTYLYQNHWYYYSKSLSRWIDGGTYGGLASDELLTESINEWLDDHPEATTTVQDGSITNNKLAAGLKKQVADIEYQKGPALSVNRISSMIKSSDAYVGDTPELYWYPQSTCTNNVDSYVIAFVSSVNGNNDTVTLRKYDNNHNLILAKTVSVNHCNDMTYYNGKIYSTAYGGIRSSKTLAIINYETLEFEEFKTLPNAFKLIAYHDEHFYTSDGQTVIKYDIDFNEMETISLNRETLNRSGALYGLTLKDDYIYIGTGYPNSIEKYDMTGELVKIYNIGYINGDYRIGEGEGLFYSDPLNGFVFTSGCTAGFLTPSVYTQNFRIDFEKNTYNGIPGNHKTFSSYSVYYVDSSNTNVNPDGSESNPYREINEAIFNGSDSLTTLRIVVSAGEYESISNMTKSNVLIIGSDVDDVIIKGVNLTFGNNVLLQNVTIKAPAAMSNYNNRALVVTYAKCSLTNVKFDCQECNNALYGDHAELILNNVSFGTTVNYNIFCTYSDIIIGAITYTQEVPLYLNVCECIKSDTLPFYNNSLQYKWTPIRYMLDEPTGELGVISVPSWIGTFLSEKKYRKIGIIVQVGTHYRTILYAPYYTGFAGGSMFDPENRNRLYSIEIQVSQKIRIGINGYTDMASGSWTNSDYVKVQGLIIE